MRVICCVLALVAIVPATRAQTVNEKGMAVATAVGQWVAVADSPALVPAAAMTVEAWGFATFVAGYPTIVRKGPNYPDNSYLIRVENNGTLLKAYINVSNNLVWFAAGIPQVANAWHHYALTFDGIDARLIFDGTVVATLNLPGAPFYTTGELLIGRGQGPIEQWIGSIDDVRLWSVARAPAQIATDRFLELGPTPGLIDSWRFNGNYSDSIGSHHGVPMGGTQNLLSTSPVVGDYFLAPSVIPVGGVIGYQISTTFGGLPYYFDISVTGTSPGVSLAPLSPLVIPLNQPWINYELGSLLPPGTFTNFGGTIPPTHLIATAVDLPSDPVMIGLAISAAFVILDPALPTLFAYMSPPRTTSVVP
jgi:Concanavalin A-like lectin/glucanases superfamily